MVPRVTSKGRSFAGAGAYFLHDLGTLDSSERVAFTHTVNMLTDDPDKALKVMAWTASHAEELKEVSGQKRTGRKADNPVYNYTLAWAPDQNPSKQEMIALGLQSLKVLGVEEHEALFIAHDDTDHKHLHVMLNRVNPVTGRTAAMKLDHLRLSELAMAYEQEHGKVYCAERVRNHAERKNRRIDKALGLTKTGFHTRTPDERRMYNEEYKARRKARKEAQQKAAALALERRRETERKESDARRLRGDFEAAAARDDLTYRARDLEPPDDLAAARAAWEDEQRLEKARLQREQEKAREAARLARKEAEWREYEAGCWQKVYDKQTERREALHERQATTRARFEERQEVRYAPYVAQLTARIETLTQSLENRGMLAYVDRIAGRQADLVGRLQHAQDSLMKLGAQREGERQSLLTRQAEAREAQRKRFEEEHARRAEQLAATKAKQDAEFLARERERAERLERERAVRQSQEATKAQRREEEKAAMREVMRESLRETERAREERVEEAAIAPQRDFGREFSQASGQAPE